MKNRVSAYLFETSPIRVVTDEEGTTWFAGKDVCLILGYANHNDVMTKRLKGVAKRYPFVGRSGPQELRMITEPDVMRLIVGSKLPAAERFERWVFEEILPTIRRTGRYELAAPPPPAKKEWPGLRAGRPRYLKVALPVEFIKELQHYAVDREVSVSTVMTWVVAGWSKQKMEEQIRADESAEMRRLFP